MLCHELNKNNKCALFYSTALTLITKANDFVFALIFFIFFYDVFNNYTALRWEIAFLLKTVFIGPQNFATCSSSRYNQFALRHFFWCFCYHCKPTGPFCYGMSKLLLSWYLIIRDEKLISDAVIIFSRYNEIVAAMWSRHSAASLCDVNKMRTISKSHRYGDNFRYPHW